MVLEPISDYGWRVDDDKLMIVWDTEENMRKG